MSSSYNLNQPPRLQLDVPNTSFSPLIANPAILSMISSPFSSPLPTLSFAPSSAPNFIDDTILSASTRYKLLPFGTQDGKEKEEIIPSKQILSVLELLERMDEDVIKEVRRVRESLKEAFALVREYADAEKSRKAQVKERKDRQLKDTKGVDDEFWLNA